jgi:hypothetical protein
MSDVYFAFAFQSLSREAARAIAVCVASALRPDAAVVPAPVPARPVAAEIIEAYLKARFELDKLSAEAIGKALRYLREITAKAPNFALGLAGHAPCLFSLGWWGHAPTRDIGVKLTHTRGFPRQKRGWIRRGAPYRTYS